MYLFSIRETGEIGALPAALAAAERCDGAGEGPREGTLLAAGSGNL